MQFCGHCGTLWWCLFACYAWLHVVSAVTSEHSRVCSTSRSESQWHSEDDTDSAFTSRVEEARTFFKLASPSSTAMSSGSAASPLSPKSPSDCTHTTSTLSSSFTNSHHYGSADESLPFSTSSKSPSAISNSSKFSASQSEKSEKAKATLTSVSESVRRDAKFSSGRQTKTSDDIEFRAVPAKAVETEGISVLLSNVLDVIGFTSVYS